MVIQKILAGLVGFSQLALGFGFLFIPDLFFSFFGFSPATADQKYLFGQLAARFLAYGIGMFLIARNPLANRSWWDLMILIQVIDFLVGVFFVAAAEGSIAVAAFPMGNALAFTILMLVFRPRNTPRTEAPQR